MGINGLTNVIKKSAPEAMETCNISSLKGKRVVVDMSIPVYQFLISIRCGANSFKDNEGNTTSHIHGIYRRFSDYISKGIIIIGVFDGKPPEEKKETIKLRNKDVSESKLKIEELKKQPQTLEIKQQIINLEKKSVKMTWQHGHDLKILLKYMGIKTFQANGEAEAACVWLVKKGYADTIMTEDMDTLVYGDPGIDMTIVRRTVTRGAPQDEIVIFHYDKIIEKFELTKEQFVDMCLLCGSDYTDSIPRIGSRTALRLIQTHKSLEKTLEVLRNKPNAIIPSNEDYQKAKNIFMLENNKLIYTDELKELIYKCQPNQLKQFLQEKNLFSKSNEKLFNKVY